MSNKIGLYLGTALALMPAQDCVAYCNNAEIIGAIGANPIYRFGSDTRLNCVGTISAGNRKYLIVYYDWNETVKEASTRGGFPHAAHRLLVFDNTHGEMFYTGFYSVDSAPLGIEGRRIRFSHRREGGEIGFGKDGPPQHVLLDGEPRSLGK
jgi:hypothetical protein